MRESTMRRSGRSATRKEGGAVTHPMTVLVLTPDTSGYYFGELLAGLTREVAGAGGRLVLVQTLEPGTRSDEVGEPGDFATPVAWSCLLYTSPSPRDGLLSRMPS